MFVYNISREVHKKLLNLTVTRCTGKRVRSTADKTKVHSFCKRGEAQNTQVKIDVYKHDVLFTNPIDNHDDIDSDSHKDLLHLVFPDASNIDTGSGNQRSVWAIFVCVN